MFQNRRLLLLVVGGSGLLILVLSLAGVIAWRMLTPQAEPAPPEAAAEALATADAAATLVAAQDATPSAAATFVQAVGGPVPDEETRFNPLFANTPAGRTVVELIYPRLLGQDPHNGSITPAALAEDWQISPDGRVYTFTVRADVNWSDGQPVTAADFKFTYDALSEAGEQSPFRDRVHGVASIRAPDPRTAVVTLDAPGCAVLHRLRRPLLPSHRFAPDFSDLSTNLLNRAPLVSAGPLRFVEQEGERIVLARNPAYWQGAPQLHEYHIQVMPDAAQRARALAAGEIDLAYFGPEALRQDDLYQRLLQRTQEAGAGVQGAMQQSDSYSFLALNLSDPTAPAPGRDEDDNVLAQPPHPILGEEAVRRAIASAIDYDRLIEELYNGAGYRLGSYVPPTASWTAAEIEPPVYDPGAAAAMLSDAGWEDADGDGVRSRDGAPLQLRLLTNAGNPLRVQLAEAIAGQLQQAGFAIEVQTVAFEELAPALLGQTYDMVVIDWENLGADPGNSPFWHTQDDAPGSGYNFTSVQDGEIDAWLDEAQTMDGCDTNQRAALYEQVQQRIAEIQPYVLLVGEMQGWAYDESWQGLAPGPWQMFHNVEEWRPAGED